VNLRIRSSALRGFDRLVALQSRTKRESAHVQGGELHASLTDDVNLWSISSLEVETRLCALVCRVVLELSEALVLNPLRLAVVAEVPEEEMSEVVEWLAVG